MPDWTTITLAIRESAGGDTFTSHLYVDETPLATNRTLSPDATQAQRKLTENYLSWFEQLQLPLVEGQTLTAIGAQLFETWLADDWADVEGEISPTDRRRFVVASDVPAVLNVPWSLLRLPGADEPIGVDPNGSVDEPIGVDPNGSVRLHPGTERLARSNNEPRPGPLRVLYSASAPRDAVELGCEKEEYQLLQTLTQPGQDVAHFGCDLGAFDELQNRVREYRPHVVHLTGHGVVGDGKAYFAFEDENGYTDRRAGDEIVNDALAGRGVQCVFVSGCETGQAPEVEATHGLCQGLVTSGVPLAVGWAASILDDVATAFGNTFYAELSAGESVDRAVVQARRDARQLCRERTEEDSMVDPSWTLPVLYAATTQADLFDPSRHEDPRKPSVAQDPLPGMTEGHADYFIGRRREQQKLLPDLRSGDLNTVLLTGLGGLGKSTLATRLARALQKDGFTPIAVPSTDDDPLTAGRLIDRCYEAFLAEDADGPYPQLRSEEIDLRDKLRLLVQILNRNRFVLVLDNFERNVDLETREILDDTLAWFLPYLVDNLTGASRCLVTTRYRPADLGDDLPPVADEHSLTDFPESAFFKYLLDDDIVEQRYRSGELPRDLLSRVYELLGGTPRFLAQVREALRDMSADELEDALDAVDLPEDEEENRIQELRDEYVQDLFVDDLYGAIEPPEAREALSRAAVYTIPMTAEGYAAVADVDEGAVRDWLDEWRRRTFVAPVETDDGGPERWVVPTLLRPWLLNQIGEEERQEAHQAAGDWLMEVYEADRTGEHLGLHFLEVELEARSRFLDAEDYERARQLTDHVSIPLVQRAVYDEAVRLNREMLEYERHPSPMNWLGRVRLGQAKYGMAEGWYQNAVEAAKEENHFEQAVARHGLAAVALEQGAYKEARKRFEEALQIHQEIGNRFGEASNRHGLARIALEQGNYEEAQGEFEEVLCIFRETGHRSGEASTRHELGRTALRRGVYENARKRFEEALQIRQEIGDRSGEARTRQQLASIAVEQGEYEEAEEEFEEVLQIWQEIEDRSGEATTRHSLARIALEQGDHEEAKAGFEEVLQIRQKIGDRLGEATTRYSLARIALEQGDYEEAKAGFEEALRTQQGIGDRSGKAATRHQLATIALRRGNYEEAEEEFEEVLEIRQEVGGWSGEATTRHNLATIAVRQGDYEEARSGFEEALRIRQQIGDRHGEGQTFAQLGILAADKLGRKIEGLRLLHGSYSILVSIEHAQAGEVGPWIQRFVDELGYDEEKLEEDMEYAQQSYAEDRGWSLIQAAFPDADMPDEIPQSGDSE